MCVCACLSEYILTYVHINYTDTHKDTHVYMHACLRLYVNVHTCMYI